MIKQILYETAILTCIIFSSGFSTAIFYDLFVLRILHKE